MAARPTIDGTQFGSIAIDGRSYRHDVVIRLDGRVEKRQKRLSKALYGTSHVISRDEAQHVFEGGAKRLIVGTGQAGLVELSPEALDFLKARACQAELLPTPDAIRAWNDALEDVIGLFHVTC